MKLKSTHTGSPLYKKTLFVTSDGDEISLNNILITYMVRTNPLQVYTIKSKYENDDDIEVIVSVVLQETETYERYFVSIIQPVEKICDVYDIVT